MSSRPLTKEEENALLLDKAKKRVKLIDLSLPIYEGMPLYPGVMLKTGIREQMSYEEVKTILGKQVGWKTCTIFLADHGATHIDSTNHFDPDGYSVDCIPLEPLYTTAICLDFSYKKTNEYIAIDEITEQLDRHQLTIQEGDAFLYYTGASKLFVPYPEGLRYLKEYPGISADACEWLMKKGVTLIGCDALSLDPPECHGPGTYPCHIVQFLKYKTLHIENMGEGLKEVVGKRFKFICIPLALKGATASPCRPIAVLEENF